MAEQGIPCAAVAVRQHYTSNDAPEDERAGAAGLLARVERVLGALGDAPPTAAQLAGLDQFHVGGLAATEMLAELAGVRRGAEVLDAGSGLGGPSRYLAAAYGCRVVGVDLVPAYVAVARLLAERTGLGERMRYAVGDLARLPFGDGAFDLVWTQHVAMNVRDRAGLYRELRRVLRAGGALAFYDVLAADGRPPLHFPVPWAAGPETSALLTEAEMRAVLREAGFAPRAWCDVTAEAAAWLPPSPREATTGPPPADAAGAPTRPTLAVVMGPRLRPMAANLARNAREGRVRFVMGVCDAGRRDAPGGHAGS